MVTINFLTISSLHQNWTFLDRKLGIFEYVSSLKGRYSFLNSLIFCNTYFLKHPSPYALKFCKCFILKVSPSLPLQGNKFRTFCVHFPSIVCYFLVFSLFSIQNLTSDTKHTVLDQSCLMLLKQFYLWNYIWT